jgi:hypothetical protein
MRLITAIPAIIIMVAHIILIHAQSIAAPELAPSALTSRAIAQLILSIHAAWEAIADLAGPDALCVVAAAHP